MVDENQTRSYSTDEQLLIQQVSDQLSLALENARLFQETKGRLKELSILNYMSFALNKSNQHKRNQPGHSRARILAFKHR